MAADFIDTKKPTLVVDMPTFESNDHGIFQGASIGHFHKVTTAFKDPLVTKSYWDKIAWSNGNAHQRKFHLIE
ncbi:hypothetical protein B9Z55_011499 [Caenorhabditis nigoni]|uniref:Uncharacterized protein n=1 Tax=Caenorhabditis nigoni TaxID=1611254 RepID=A0A2G5UKD4_9PELO|nr:hypothetical protein B9Z55_011499 [Caenorhabditis nigoni]